MNVVDLIAVSSVIVCRCTCLLVQRLINRVRCLIYFPRLILRSKLTPADQIRKIKVNNDPAEALFGSVAGEQEYDRKISNTKQRWNNTPQLPLNNIYIYIYFHPVNYEKNFVCCSSCCYYGLEVRACLT